MSIEEQDQRLGRLLREREQAKKDIAILSDKAGQFEDALKQASEAMRSVWGPDVIRNAANSIPNRSDVLVFADELTAAVKIHRQSTELLRAAGYPLPD